MLTCKRKHAVVIIEKMTAVELFLRMILLWKDLRTPLFPFLRLNVVVWYRISRLLILYLSCLYRLLHFRLLYLLLHRAGQGGGPEASLYNLSKEDSHYH